MDLAMFALMMATFYVSAFNHGQYMHTKARKHLMASIAASLANGAALIYFI